MPFFFSKKCIKGFNLIDFWFDLTEIAEFTALERQEDIIDQSSLLYSIVEFPKQNHNHIVQLVQRQVEILVH